MKITECYWELKNLDSHVVEVSIEKNDTFDASKFSFPDKDYVVVKVPVGDTAFNFGLSALNYVMIESQLSMSKALKCYPFEDRLVKYVSSKTELVDVSTHDELQEILDEMTVDMFSTDRIYLDPHFGPKMSMRRYRNWMQDEFEQGTSQICKVVEEGAVIGFFMFKMECNVCDGLLGGIFEKYQNGPYGILTPVSPALYLQRNNIACKILKTHISSNNMPVLTLYNYLGYKIDQITNVFIKHNIKNDTI